ncbi:Segregation and condensation protein B [uncultured Ruminococcus sp.]|nr:Segregation and condensation protein B [uncultured Clostridium sp.]SCH73648.1 Segregation and condensation protein B [uncultured Ruminococcus sp.]
MKRPDMVHRSKVMRMEYKKYYGMIEAVLFASGEPVALDRLSEAVEIDRQTLLGLMPEFMAQYQTPEHGVQVVKLGESYQMCSKKEYEGCIKHALEIKRNTPLSQAAMETLAIIAYNQPVTKSFVEQVRGVDSSQTVNNLVEKGLVEEAGRLDVPGRPITYQTTDNFLRSFQISSLKELPPLPDESGQIQLEEIVVQE